MAHSYVTSFSSLDQLPESAQKDMLLDKVAEVQDILNFSGQTNRGELAAFLSYAIGQPKGFTCLIDSYDTIQSGLVNYLAVSIVMLLT